MDHSGQPFDMKLSTVVLFCKAAELGSFTAAAHALSLTPAAVSRGVGRLEERLGLKLFRRTTRSMQLTDDGRLYFEQCKTALAQIEEAERIITGQHNEPRGMLRISAPSTYAHYRLMSVIAKFKQRYPLIELEVNVSNRNIDFVEEGYDIAIRMGQPQDSRLVARKLEDAALGIFASADYLKRHGTPKQLDALTIAKHTFLPFIRPSTGKIIPWLLHEEATTREWTPPATVRISEDPLGCVELARHGAGIVQTFDWIGTSHQELTHILKKFAGGSRPFYLLYPQNKHLSTKVRVFVDELLAHLKKTA